MIVSRDFIYKPRFQTESNLNLVRNFKEFHRSFLWQIYNSLLCDLKNLFFNLQRRRTRKFICKVRKKTEVSKTGYLFLNTI